MVDYNILFASRPMDLQAVNERDVALEGQRLDNALKMGQIGNNLLDQQSVMREFGEQEAKQQMKDMATDAIQLKPLLASGDTTRANVLLAERIDKIFKRGGDPSDTMAFRDALNSGQLDQAGAIRELDGVVNAAQRLGLLEGDTGGRKFAPMPAFDAQGNPVFVQGSQDGGLSQISGWRPYTPTLQEKTAADIVKSSAQSEIDVKTAEGKKRAELEQEIELRPTVASRVAKAERGVEDAAKVSDENRKNASTLAVYQQGIDNLTSSLAGTTTGYGMNWIPAITADAQKAEGAIKAMAPLLKQVFREAGEGSFTEGDQKLLLGMIPDRNTLPEARDSQLRAIDAMVRAKLAQKSVPGVSPADLPPIPDSAPRETSGGWSIKRLP